MSEQAERVESGLVRLVSAFQHCGFIIADEGQMDHESETRAVGTCTERHQALERLTYIFTAKTSAYLNSNPSEHPASA